MTSWGEVHGAELEAVWLESREEGHLEDVLQRAALEVLVRQPRDVREYFRSVVYLKRHYHDGRIPQAAKDRMERREESAQDALALGQDTVSPERVALARDELRHIPAAIIEATIEGKRQPQTHCARGHELTPGNTGVVGSNRYCKRCRSLVRRRVREVVNADVGGAV